MKIGDECYVHGYVDEIRNDTIIIRNEGGYFGTVKSEVLTAPAEYVRVIRCKDCKHRPWKVYDDKGKFLGVDAPDEMCPCQCEDNFYNYVPDDDWYCANGEMKENA